MSATSQKNKAANDVSPGTLGALLYADATRPRVAESEWLALVRAMGAGNAGALRALYERMHRLVYTLALRITQSPETAEEVTVDTFHDAWRRASAYDPGTGTVIAWIMNLARSRAIDRVRFEQRKKRTNAHAAADASSASVASDGSGALQLTQLASVLRDGLGSLTAAEREAIELAFFSELSHTAVAARLQQPLGTIKTRIRSGLGKLRAALGATGRTP